MMLVSLMFNNLITTSESCNKGSNAPSVRSPGWRMDEVMPLVGSVLCVSFSALTLLDG